MSEETTSVQGELPTTELVVPQTTIRAAIAWGIINVSDELIYWFLLGIGAIAMISGRDVRCGGQFPIQTAPLSLTRWIQLSHTC